MPYFLFIAALIISLPGNAQVSANTEVYIGGQSLITGTWSTKISEIADESPYEGSTHLKFANYDLAGGWWDGFGLNFNNWGASAPLNLSGVTHLRFAYRGMSPGHILQVRIGDPNSNGQLYNAGEATDTYQIIEIPISVLSPGLDIKSIIALDINVGGSEFGTGNLYVDAIEFVNKSNLIYKSGFSLVKGTWSSKISEISTEDPFEGVEHYKFSNYDLAGAWWDGFGLNFNNFGAGAPLNFTGKTHLRFAYRGVSTGNVLQIRLRDTVGLGTALDIGEPSDVYTMVNVPLSVIGAGLQLNAISEINFSVGGAAQGTGNVFIDAIELIDSLNQGGGPITLAHTRANQMGIGANISNWLEAHWLISSGNFPITDLYSRQDVERFADCGFKTLRLPIIFQRIALPDPPYTLQTSHPMFELIDSMIVWTDMYDLKLIIDNHHASPELSDANYLTEIPHITAIWQQIIAKYGNLDPERVFFEIYNEPNGISNTNLRAVNNAVVSAIRATGNNHTLIVGASGWNSGNQLPIMGALADTNLIYTFHSYSPFCFCNQGFDWNGDGQPDFCAAGVPFPSDVNIVQNLTNEFGAVDYWAKSNNVPIFLGEFGVSVFADSASRCNWIEAMGNILDQYQFPACYWDPKHLENAYGFFANETITQENVVPCFSEALHLSCGTSTSTNQPVVERNLLMTNVFPNPTVQNDLRVSVKSDKNRKIILELYNTSSQRMQSKQFEISEGTQDITMKINDVPAGIFLLVLLDENGKFVQTFRLVKQ